MGLNHRIEAKEHTSEASQALHCCLRGTGPRTALRRRTLSREVLARLPPTRHRKTGGLDDPQALFFLAKMMFTDWARN